MTAPDPQRDAVTLSCIIRAGQPAMVIDTPGHPLNRQVVRCPDSLKRPGAQYSAHIKLSPNGVVNLLGGASDTHLLPTTLPASAVWTDPIPDHLRRSVLRDGEGVPRAVTAGDVTAASVAPHLRNLLMQRNARHAMPGQADWSDVMGRGLDVVHYVLYPHEPHPTDDLDLPVPTLRHRRDLEPAERFVVEGNADAPRCHHETCAAAFAREAVTARAQWAWAAAPTEERAWALWRQALDLPAAP